LLAFILFNLIGLLNEVMQNQWGGRSLFVFTADSVKDVCMNLTGAFVFMMAVVWRVWWLRRNVRTI
jgi:VanZ family protein